MRLIFGLVLIAGLALAGGAVYLAQTYIGSYQQALENERSKNPKIVPMTQIYIASRDIAFGEQIKDKDMALVDWPRAHIPKGAFFETSPLNKTGDALRVTMRGFIKNEAFLASNVSEPGADSGLTSRLERGQRAFTIEVDVSTGVSGFLRPGDRVDVYWTGQPPLTAANTRRGDVTKLIQSGIRLIAIDQTSNEQATKAAIARTVTVAATPKQVAALTQAQSTGHLTLSLLGLDEENVTEAIEIDQNELLGIQAPRAEVVAQKKQVCTIRTRKGSEVLEIAIPCTN